MTLLDNVRKTTNHAEHFGARLTLDQLYFRLLSNKTYSQNEIERTVIKNKITLNNTANLEYIKKLNIAKRLVDSHLLKFTDILMVGITGSTAAENARAVEDIDLFIVCKNNSLWWTRFRLRIYVLMNHIPHRKYGRDEDPNDFCFNLWMEENDLLVPKQKQDLKNAVDLIMMKILFNKNNVYEQFLEANSWANRFVANGYTELRAKNCVPAGWQINKYKNSIIKTCLNYVVYLGQITYIRLKGPIKFINLTQAFFHK